MESLASILYKIKDENVKQDLLSASITFPRTDIMIQDTPIVSYHKNTDTAIKIDYKDLNSCIDSSLLFTSEIKDDLQWVIILLAELEDHLQFNKFDMIEIWRNGLCMVRVIMNPEKQCVRCIHVDMSEYRRRCLQYIAPNYSSLQIACCTGLVVSVVTLIVQYCFIRNKI